MQTYLFYDIETSGLNKAFDQVLHFAAIRTDMDLNEIERLEAKIKLNPDLIPAPYATITHHIGVKEAQTGISEFSAMQQIHQWVNTPGTISLGYNTLGFDDEFLRFSFYRNLLPPYTHQYANQCARMDLYPMTALYFLVKNEILTWPTINGEPRLKLELINQANQFIQGRSHHAMVDVEVTLALARRLRQEREVWDYTLGYFNKAIDQERCNQLQTFTAGNKTFPEGLLVDGIMGGKQNFMAPVLSLGEHTTYKNQVQWLRLDTLDLTQTTPETLATTTWVIRKKWGEPGFILPCKPRFLKWISPEREALIARNKEWLAKHPDILAEIALYHCNFLYPDAPETDTDARLYLNGFLSAEDMNASKRFHQIPDTDKGRFIDTFKNPTLQILSTRLLGRHNPALLTDSQRTQYQSYCDSVWKNADNSPVDFRGNYKLNAQTALAQIAELRLTELSQEQTQLLNELETYLHTP